MFHKPPAALPRPWIEIAQQGRNSAGSLARKLNLHAYIRRNKEVPFALNTPFARGNVHSAPDRIERSTPPALLQRETKHLYTH
jgi:hypothetical protein